MNGDRTAIVTDSAADLPVAWRAGRDVEAVPLTVRIDGADHLDGVDLAAEEFWARARRAAEPPTTASPSPEAFAAAFARAGAAGASSVVCVTLASGLSSTFQSATLAARGAGHLDVRVLDSRSASHGQALVVEAAVSAASDGPDAAAAAARDVAARVEVFGMLGDLEHLRRSGRLRASHALLGSVLSVKPLIRLHDGAVEAVGRQRTVPRALDALATLVLDALPERLVVMHGDADPATVGSLVERLRDAGTDPPVHLLGPVVGAHLGPGTVGVALLRPRPAP